MARRVSSPVFVGRADELGELVAAMTRAAEGTPGLVLIGGEAGVGKSRLVSELAARGAHDGLRVVVGQCVELDEATIPLLPVADALRGLAEDGAPDLPSATLSPAGGTLAEGPSSRVHVVVLDRLAEAAAADPIVLIIEDVHWADRSTLELLRFLSRRLRDERILVVATYRDDEVDRREDLRRFLADVATAPAVQRLALERLTHADMRDQLAGILGAPPPPELLEAVFARSEGNAFFAEELLAAGHGDGEGLPATLRDMLLARIATLDDSAQAVVRVAAAGGRQVHHRLLATAAGLPEPQLSAALRAAVRHHVLVAVNDGFGFRHALVREAAYGELLPGERAAVHAAFATALAERPELAQGNDATLAAEIAHHWLRAGDEPRALAAAVRAGAQAADVGALAEAADHFAHALALWPVVADPERVAAADRATLLVMAANATAYAGRPGEAVDMLDEALALVDGAAEPARAAAVHKQRGLHLWWSGRGRESLADFERAVELIPAAPASVELAGALEALAHSLMLMSEHARARYYAEQAIAVASSVGAPVHEAGALNSLGTTLMALGDLTGGLDRLREGRAVAQAAGDPEAQGRTATGLCDGLRRAGHLAEAVEVGLEGAAGARRAGLDLYEGFCRLNAAEAAFELGRWELVDELVGDLLTGKVAGVTLTFAHHMTATVAIARGDFDTAEHHMAAEHTGAGPQTTPELASYALELAAELALWRGQPEAGAAAADECLRYVKGRDSSLWAVIALLSVRAQADRAQLARARRDEAAASAACERARELRDVAREHAAPDPVSANIEGEYARALGRADPALWKLAADAWEARPCPYRAAYARWRQAEAVLQSDRDRPQATTALVAAHATATSLGAVPLREEVERLARRARIALSDESDGSEDKAAAPGADAEELGLTPREREVLERLALGETNRQIADALFISARTAGVHVSRILSKLGASNRSEAAAIAHRLGLVS